MPRHFNPFILLQHNSGNRFVIKCEQKNCKTHQIKLVHCRGQNKHVTNQLNQNERTVHFCGVQKPPEFKQNRKKVSRIVRKNRKYWISSITNLLLYQNMESNEIIKVLYGMRFIFRLSQSVNAVLETLVKGLMIPTH